MYLTQKIRVYPTKQTKETLDTFFRITIFIYNKCIEYMVNNNTAITNVREFLNKISTSLMTNKKKEIFNSFLPTWQYKVVSRAICNYKRCHLQKITCRLKKYDANIQSFHITDAYTETMSKRNLYIPGIGYLKYRYISNLKGKCIGCTIKKVANSIYYVIINLKVDKSSVKSYPKTGKMVGLDVGLKDLVTTSDGEKYSVSKAYLTNLVRAKRIQKRLAKMKPGGSNYLKLRQKLQLLFWKIENQKENYQHAVSLNLIRKYDYIFTEDFITKELMSKPGNKINYTNAAISSFLHKVSYKSIIYDKTTHKIDRYFPSSQICSNCGRRDHSLKNTSIRNWRCKYCQMEHDRDVNAAKNILEKGISEYKLWFLLKKKKNN